MARPARKTAKKSGLHKNGAQFYIWDMLDYNQVPSPCFVLDEKRLVRNMEILDDIQKRTGAKIICALKGYSFWRSFPLIARYLPGATASSLNEARLAREEMNKEVHVFAPVYGDDEIDQILSLADHISFNSFGQWQRFKDKTLAAGESAGIRVNPQFSTVETDLYNPCGKFSRLGVTEAEFKPELLDGIEGLHFHALCEPLDVSQGSVSKTPVHPRDVFCEAVRYRAFAVIVAHNHPSGDPEPSKEDVEITERLIETGKLLGIRLLDHLVLGSPGLVKKEGFVSIRNLAVLKF